ncbi:hypothetical protein KZ843_28935, partial [Pseudomonas aeruginosa]
MTEPTELPAALPRLPPQHLPRPRLHQPPVSYTHLRAHETCADLVCRLPLEKKKITFTQTTPRSP